VPPLDHARVHRLKKRLGDFPVVINGGIRSLDDADGQLAHVDGVMLGRAAYENPSMLLEVDRRLFGDYPPLADSRTAVEALFPYVEHELARGVRLHDITRHLLGMFRGVPGARLFRRHLAIEAVKPGAGMTVLRQALALVVDNRAEFTQTAA
jgi:tRNA-dihydrouridine synthase A